MSCKRFFLTFKLKKIASIASFVLFIVAIFLVDKIPEALPNIENERLEMLQECARHHTKKIEVIRHQDISRLENFYRTVLQPIGPFPLFLFSFKPSWIPWIKGQWSYTALGPIDGTYKDNSENLLKWLNQYYHTKKPFKFFYLAQEPYLRGCQYPQDIGKKFAEVLKNCPLLISCTHPDLPWTQQCILMPDPYLLSQGTQNQLESLLNSTKLLPFSERKSTFYFRGALTGPRLPFSYETMKHNPRHLLLKKVKIWPFLDYKITSFDSLDLVIKPDYKEYILKNYSWLKGDTVDFFEHAKHKYLLSFDGYGSAWSRVPLILATGSVLVLNAFCHQYFYCLMVENETYVGLNGDLSNGEKIYHDLENNPTLAEKIGTQGRKIARLFLTKSAVDTYLWLTLKEIEKVSH